MTPDQLAHPDVLIQREDDPHGWVAAEPDVTCGPCVLRVRKEKAADLRQIQNLPIDEFLQVWDEGGDDFDYLASYTRAELLEHGETDQLEALLPILLTSSNQEDRLTGIRLSARLNSLEGPIPPKPLQHQDTAREGRAR